MQQKQYTEKDSPLFDALSMLLTLLPQYVPFVELEDASKEYRNLRPQYDKFSVPHSTLKAELELLQVTFMNGLNYHSFNSFAQSCGRLDKQVKNLLSLCKQSKKSLPKAFDMYVPFMEYASNLSIFKVMNESFTLWNPLFEIKVQKLKDKYPSHTTWDSPFFDFDSVKRNYKLGEESFT